MSGNDTDCLLWYHRIQMICSWEMTGVSPSELPALMNSNYCTGSTVSYTDVMVPILCSLHYFLCQRLNLTIKLNRLFLRRPLETDTLDWVLSSLYIVTRRSLVDVTHSWLGVHPYNLINSVVCLLFILFTVFVCNSEYNRFPSLSTAISKANLP